jgi:hypothetical protein
MRDAGTSSGVVRTPSEAAGMEVLRMGAGAADGSGLSGSVWGTAATANGGNEEARLIPRLRFCNHVWSCISWGPYKAGYGYTVQEAFLDWEKQ